MNQNSTMLRTLAFVAIAAVVGAAIYIMLQPERGDTIPTGAEVPAQGKDSYSNAEFGISFTYPDSYVLTERDMPGSAERGHHVITIMDREAAANIPEAGEGPTSITIDFFQNNLDNLTVEQWVKNTSNSNFKLSTDQKLTNTTLAGSPALSYTWDGLYWGESIAAENRGYIVVFSVTSISAEDQIRSDFVGVLESIRFE